MKQITSQRIDTLYDEFNKDLTRLTGEEQSDAIQNMIGSNPQANNASVVSVSGSDIMSGVSTDTSIAATGSQQAGKKMFDNTATGYILGVDPKDGFAKFYIGSSTNYLNWDGASLTIKGSISASSIDIPDTSTANSFHVDSMGNAWWGATTLGLATASVLNTGAATFTNITIAGYVLQSVGSFGGDGSDGALSVSSGTTTIDLGGATVFTKNYTSISITGTGAIAFTNPAAGGTLIIFKSQGAVAIISSATRAIDLRLLGGTGGTAGAAGGTTVGNGGAGGASSSASGTAVAFTPGTNGNNGGNGQAFGNWIGGSISGGGAGNKTAAASAPTNPGYTATSVLYVKPMIVPGSGGGGGEGGQFRAGTNSGVGGRGGGALLIECNGALNFSGTIDASGETSANDTGANPGSGTGGGGGGGSVELLYKTLTANSGTITLTGGSAGTSTNGAVGTTGATGLSVVAQNKNFA